MTFKIFNLDTEVSEETQTLPTDLVWVKKFMQETGEICVCIGSLVIERIK